MTAPSVWTRGIIAHCTICGELDRLIRFCTRCHKYACEKDDCIKAITALKLCKVPEQSLTKNNQQS